MTASSREQIAAFLEAARWFGGKGRAFEVTSVRRLRVAETDPHTGLVVCVELVTLEYLPAGTGRGAGTDIYQLPVSYYSAEQIMLHHALIGEWDDEELGHVWAYDALHDHAATPHWLHGFLGGESTDPAHAGGGSDLVFHRVGEPKLDPEARSTLMSVEQSNSSVAFGDESLMKLFRRVTPGVNPDIEILAALTEAGNEHVPALYGWVEVPATGDGALGDGGAEPGDDVLQLGILQQFLRTASDGWELALASLRNLYAAESGEADQAGGDFAAEAHRLGVAVADLHRTMASAFPVESWDRGRLAELADAMSRRLDDAVTVVPQIEAHAAGLHGLFDAVRHLTEPVVASRVHGDLHLGQTLRTVKNWKIIDFEGEPAKPLSERRLPDSPWRDVAGMLRSFDYAAELSRIDRREVVGHADETDMKRAREWAARNVRAFLTGYREARGAAVDGVLLTAYAADKAVYEAVYEARNRPQWLPIPLDALARLVSGPLPGAEDEPSSTPTAATAEL